MNDIELAEEIERHLSPDAIYWHWEPSVADMEQIIAALRRGPERQPSGEMVMVPREPTEAMLIAGYEAHQQAGPQREKWLTASYRAMIAAAPQKEAK